MSEPTDPREIRHNAGAHTFGLNPVPPSENGQHHHHLTAENVKCDLRLMDPKTIRERHMQTVLGRTRFDRDLDRKVRAEFAVKLQYSTSSEKESMRQRCVAIINSLEHMEIDKDIALLALEKLCGVDD